MPGRNVMLESTSGTCAFEVPRNWKQAPTIFWLLPAWSLELETGMSHFFGVALRGVPRGVPCGVPLNPGVTGLKEAILEFFSWESLGAGSDAGQARPGFYAGQLGPRSHWQKKLQVLPPHDNLDILGRTGFYFFLVCRAGWAMPGRFAETVGLDDSFDFFSWEESRPWRGLVRSANPPNPHSPRVPCYMCYMCYISQGKPLNNHSPRVPCYMCYMCYISQGTEHPLFSGSLLYVLYVLYGPI